MRLETNNNKYHQAASNSIMTNKLKLKSNNVNII